MLTDFSTRKTKAGPNMPVKASPATRIKAGQKTVSAAGSPERLSDASHKLEAGVYIKALSGNGGDIYILHAEGSGNGYVLDAGESVFLEIVDLYLVWLDTDNGGDGVSYLAS